MGELEDEELSVLVTRFMLERGKLEEALRCGIDG